MSETDGWPRRQGQGIHRCGFPDHGAAAKPGWGAGPGCVEGPQKIHGRRGACNASSYMG